MATQTQGPLTYGLTDTLPITAPTDPMLFALVGLNKWANTNDFIGFSNTHISYSFPTSTTAYDFVGGNAAVPEADTFTSLSAEQELAVETWFDQFLNVAGIHFDLCDQPGSGYGSASQATIKIANSKYAATLNLDSYSTGPQASLTRAGDVWYDQGGDAPKFGNADWQAIGSEIAHAVGLTHGDVSELVDGILPSKYNSSEYSIMTSARFEGDTSDGEVGDFGAAQSLMIADIAALQYMYGANFVNDSITFTFDLKTGEMFEHGVRAGNAPATGQGAPGENVVFRTIWAGGGSADHYDFSNYETNMSISLRAGDLTNFDVDGNFQRADLGDGQVAKGHLYNALLFEGDTRSLIENVTAGIGDDTIMGNRVDNYIVGNLGADTINGGLGSDTLGYKSASFGVTVNLSTGLAIGGAGNDTFENIENIDGSNHIDRLYGDAQANRLSSFDGDDTIYGSHGDDVFDGGEGFDTLSYQFSDVSVTIDLENATAVTSLSDSTFSNFEKYVGSELSDLMLGDANANIFEGDDGDDSFNGLGGDDTFDGGEGRDSILYTNAAGSVTVDMLAGTATGADGTDSFTNIEKVYASGFDDVITGNKQANFLYGFNGNDTINYVGGNDTIDGGSDIDTLSFAKTDTGVVMSVEDSEGDVAGGNFTFSNMEIYIGSDHDDILTGDSGQNTISGGGGSDIISGGRGQGVSGSSNYGNILDGGDGIDTISFARTSETVFVNLTSGSATIGGQSDEITNFENVIGTAYADYIEGDNADNVITSGGGSDSIFGYGGSDTVILGHARNSYDIEEVSLNVYTVTHEDGDVIRLEGMEYIQFSNVTYTLGSSAPTSEPAPDLSIEQYNSDLGFEQNVYFDDYFDDPDGDELTYSAIGLPEGFVIDPEYGEVFGQATGDLGTHQVRITATDPSDQSAFIEFELAVVAGLAPEPENDTPIALTIDNVTSEAGAIIDENSVTQQIADRFSDPNGDFLLFYDFGLPDGLRMSGVSGIVSGTITAGEGSYIVTVVAIDDFGAAVASEFTWTITAALPTLPFNSSPTSSNFANLVSEKSASFDGNDSAQQLATYFADADSDTLTYSATGLPDGLKIDASTGKISGQILASSSIYTVTVKATDTSEASANLQFDWAITEQGGSGEAPSNHAPTPSAIADITSDENSLQSFVDMSSYFTDADAEALTYTATGLPDGLVLDSATGVISGQLTASAGSYEVTITATDAANTYGSAQFKWVVASSTTGPVLVNNIVDNDTILKTLGNWDLSGLDGHDSIFLMAGANSLDGDSGSDFLIGGFEADNMSGGAGNDVMRGDASDLIGGSDNIDGGSGNDIMMGGLGADTFKFNVNDGQDVIGQFKIVDVNFDAANGFTTIATAADFQSGIDHIELEGFAGLDASNVMDSIEDVDGAAVFSAEGTEISFFGVLESQLDANDFTFS